MEGSRGQTEHLNRMRKSNDKDTLVLIIETHCRILAARNNCRRC
jgi:hypothetical protein